MPRTTAEQLERWGLEAADSFLTAQAALNDTITKIASDNYLNKEQIQRVCEFANLRVYEDMMKTAGDKRAEFPLADVFAIQSTIKDVPDMDMTDVGIKLSSTDLSKLQYHSAEMTARDIFLPLETKIKIAKVELDKLANKTIPMSTRIDAFLKIAEMRDQIKTKEVQLDSKKTDVKEGLKSTIQTMMDHGHSFQDLYNIAIKTHPDKAANMKTMFDTVATELKESGKLDPAVKLSHDPLLNMACAIVKHAEIEATPRDIQTLQARKQFQMLIGEWIDTDNEHAKCDNTVGYINHVIEKVRGKMREGVESKNPSIEDDDLTSKAKK